MSVKSEKVAVKVPIRVTEKYDVKLTSNNYCVILIMTQAFILCSDFTQATKWDQRLHMTGTYVKALLGIYNLCCPVVSSDASWQCMWSWIRYSVGALVIELIHTEDNFSTELYQYNYYVNIAISCLHSSNSISRYCVQWYI